jgi:hypothetical protein
LLERIRQTGTFAVPGLLSRDALCSRRMKKLEAFRVWHRLLPYKIMIGLVALRLKLLRCRRASVALLNPAVALLSATNTPD